MHAESVLQQPCTRCYFGANVCTMGDRALAVQVRILTPLIEPLVGSFRPYLHSAQPRYAANILPREILRW